MGTYETTSKRSNDHHKDQLVKIEKNIKNPLGIEKKKTKMQIKEIKTKKMIKLRMMKIEERKKTESHLVMKMKKKRKKKKRRNKKIRNSFQLKVKFSKALKGPKLSNKSRESSRNTLKGILS